MPEGIKAAYAAAWDEVRNPLLDGVNPHFKSKFATLKAVMGCVRDACSKHGIAYRQTVNAADGGYVLSSAVCDGDEELPLSSLAVPDNQNPQQFGSALTYMRRYQALTDWGIVGDPDDDGNGASADGHYDPNVQRAEQTDAQQDKHAEWVMRVVELKTRLIEAGMPSEDIEEWYEEHYGTVRVSDLGKEQLTEFGQWLKKCVDMRKGNADVG